MNGPLLGSWKSPCTNDRLLHANLERILLGLDSTLKNRKHAGEAHTFDMRARRPEAQRQIPEDPMKDV